MTQSQVKNKLRESGFFYAESAIEGWTDEAFRHHPEFNDASIDDFKLEKFGEEVEITLFVSEKGEMIIDEFQILDY